MEVGTIVRSKCGHDCKRLYLIVAVVNSEFVLIADGKHRKLEKPKLKRQKHLSFVTTVNIKDVTDVKIRNAIKKLNSDGGMNAEKR